MQCEFGADSPLKRDRLVITPHFLDQGPTTDPGNLCQGLANGLSAWSASSREVRVTAYDALGGPPNSPLASKVVNENLFPATSGPREVALCLSFYSHQNEPRKRGRLYIPWTMVLPANTPRPSSGTRDKVAELAPLFANLGGADVDWCVYSRADDEFKPVTHWYVDNEWDTVRSRGLRPTDRTSGTTNEAGGQIG
jgi:hypothetical protein